MFDAIKNYLALATGVTEVTRQRALSAAKALVTSGEATAEQVTNLADDLLATSRNNRDTILALMRYEIDRALVRLGLATSEEFAALAQRISSVESNIRDAVAALGSDRSDTPPAGDRPAAESAAPGAPLRPTKRATKAARKAPAKRSPAKRSPAKRVAGGTSPGASFADASPRQSPGTTVRAAVDPPVPAKRAPAKKAPANKAPANAPVNNAPVNKAPVNKAPAKKAPAQKATARVTPTIPPAKKAPGRPRKSSTSNSPAPAPPPAVNRPAPGTSS